MLQNNPLHMNRFPYKKNRKARPILVIDQLTEDFGIPPQKRKKNEKNISRSEENLLTLIANVIIEIILKEELWMQLDIWDSALKTNQNL